MKKITQRDVFKSDVESEEYTIIAKHKDNTNDSKEKNLIKKWKWYYNIWVWLYITRINIR